MALLQEQSYKEKRKHELEKKYQLEEAAVQKYRAGLKRSIQRSIDRDGSGVFTAQSILFLLKQNKI